MPNPVSRTVLGEGISQVKRFSDGRELVSKEDGTQVVLGGLSTSQAKAAFALGQNVEHLVNLYGLNHCGFLTLTFPDNVTDFKEAQRRFNSLATNFLKVTPHILDWIVTLEPQKRGSCHYHLVVALSWDIRTGFDFEAVTKRDYSSASSDLRAMWATLRHSAPKYGFGRTELLPIKSTGEGVAKYVGKYIEKGAKYRGEQFKGARMVRYTRGWKKASPRFSWTSPAATQWRALVSDVADLAKCQDNKAMQKRFGKSWGYRLLKCLEADPDLTARSACVLLSSTKPIL